MAITRLLAIRESKTHDEPHYHLKNAIFYICNPEKTEGGTLVGGNAGSSPETILYTMLFNKQQWKKTDQRQGYHYILSFAPDDPVDVTLAGKIAEEFAEQVLGGNYYYTTAIHNDKKHLHIHMIFDSVSKTDGIKYHPPMNDWEKRIQPIADKICEKYNLSTLIYDKFGDRKGKSYKEWRMEQQKEKGENAEAYSAYDVIRDDIDEAIKNSDSYEAFLLALKNMQYEITRDQKYLSVKPHFRKKAVRTGRLGSGYDKESIQLRIMAEKTKNTVFSHYKHYGDMKEINSYLYIKVRRVKGWKMSPFQKGYYRRMYRLFHIRRPRYYDQSWRYKKDILQVKKISKCTMYMMKHDLRGMEDVVVKEKEIQDILSTVDAKLKSLKTRLYCGEVNKLVREYQRLGDDADPDMKKQLFEQIEKHCPYEEAAKKVNDLQEEIKQIQIAIRDIKKELKTVEDIKNLYGEPEHFMVPMISAAAKTELKKRRKSNHKKQER